MNEIKQIAIYIWEERSKLRLTSGRVKPQHLQPMILGRSFPILASVVLPPNPAGWQGDPSGGVHFLSAHAT